MMHVGRRLLGALSLALAAVPQVHGQDTMPVTVVRAARLLDIVRGTIVQPGVLLVQGDRILRVGGRDVPPGRPRWTWATSPWSPG